MSALQEHFHNGAPGLGNYKGGHDSLPDRVIVLILQCLFHEKFHFHKTDLSMMPATTAHSPIY
jgi:hypothetical protein